MARPGQARRPTLPLRRRRKLGNVCPRPRRSSAQRSFDFGRAPLCTYSASLERFIPLDQKSGRSVVFLYRRFFVICGFLAPVGLSLDTPPSSWCAQVSPTRPEQPSLASVGGGMAAGAAFRNPRAADARVRPVRSYIFLRPPCRKSGALEQLFCGRASVAATGRNWCCTGLWTRTVQKVLLNTPIHTTAYKHFQGLALPLSQPHPL